MSEVTDAIILAGGLGTRMLPASLYAPKETLPLVDTPLINHLILEAANSGVRNIHLVLSEKKRSFLEEFLQNEYVHGPEIRPEIPRDAIRLHLDGINLFPHIQKVPGGVGDAISVAIGHIDGPFLVLLGDMVITDKHYGPINHSIEMGSNASKQLIERFEETGIPNVGVYPVEGNEISKYGVVRLSDEMVSDIEEKPPLESAPSKYVLCGRYIFPDNTEEILLKYPSSEFGEMQSIKLLKHLIGFGGLNAVKLDNFQMYDSGDPMTWLQSQVDHALRRDDEGIFHQWLRTRLE